MALSEVIKYEGDNSTFIWKHPNEDFNNMTELIVHESQEAILFANGQAADIFGPGRYKLDVANMPILSKLVNFVTGVGIFHCEIYFINKTVQMALKWGTDSKVHFIEPTLGVPIELGASGEMNIAISDGKKLLMKLVGTMKGVAWSKEGIEFTKSLQDSFKPLISTAVKSNLSATIKQQNIDIVEVDVHLLELSEVLRKKILPGFEEYGLTIPQFYLTNIVFSENDQNLNKLKDLHTITLQKRMAEAEAKIKVAQREAILEEQTTETEVAKYKAERMLIQAQVEAQATQIAGMAEATVMQAQGYNKKDIIQAEVQKAYAEGLGNMGGVTTGGISVVGDMVGVGVGMAAMTTMVPQVNEMMKGLVTNTSNYENVQGNAMTRQVIKCPDCGNELPINAKFCLECGTKIEESTEDEMTCPNCGKRTSKGKFCMECGSQLINKCPKCGVEVPQGGKFCLECGTKLN